MEVNIEESVVLNCLCSFLLLGICRDTHRLICVCVCVCFPTHFDLPSHHMITDNNALIMQARIKMFPCLNGSCIVILQLYFGAPCINSVDLYIIYCPIKINTRLHDLTSYSFNISLVSQCASEQ